MVILDRPLPFVDIEIDKINELIRNIIGGNEDAFQNTWVDILEKKPINLEQIRDIAQSKRKEAVSNYIANKYKTRSMDKPLSAEEGETRTLYDVLPSKVIEQSPSDIERPRLWKANYKSSCNLDAQTSKILKEKYPHLTYTQAVRMLVGLPIKLNLKKWQPWEDEILREQYPHGGSLAVGIEVKRSRNGISTRARRLGVHFKGYNFGDEILRTKDVCKILSTSKGRVNLLVKQGMLKAQRIKGRGGYRIFKKGDLCNFLKEHPFQYRHDLLPDDYKGYVPKWVWKWLSPAEVAITLHICKDTIRERIRLGELPYRSYLKNAWYCRLEDAEHCVEMRKLRRQPYKVWESPSGIRHYVYQDEENDWYLKCKGKQYKPICLFGNEKLAYFTKYFRKGFPTCKVCLSLLRAYRKRKTISCSNDNVKEAIQCQKQN